MGFGKCVLDSDTKELAEKIHVHQLRQFAKESEHLGAVHSIQVFTEFEVQNYPHEFNGFEDQPNLLDDMNVLDKAFKTIIAWDNNQIVPNPRPSSSTLGSHLNRYRLRF